MEDLKKEEQVVLVDKDNKELGLMGKLEAHKKGLLHRAISVIIFNSKGEMLIQKRALAKYHWAGIWSNTCCSHPRANESFQQAAGRRLFEELGFHTPLKEVFRFIYKAKDKDSGLTEHELDAVFTGTFDNLFVFNKDEIDSVRWISVDDLLIDVELNSHKYSFWFKIILEQLQNRKII